ncbi:MAG: sensor histidine kinase, partial [Mycobacterium sp.]
LIFPVAGRLRTWVDRFVLGERADPLATVDSIGAGLRTSTDDPTGTMLEAVASATGASYAELRTPAGVRTVGQPHGDVVEIPLVHADKALGTLTVGPRRGERRVTDGDARLLAAIAPHLAVVIQTQRLANDLDREKQRVASATEAERDRLRHDLHDGLGPSLSGIALGIQAVSQSLGTESQASRNLLERTRTEADNAVREIRRVIDGLRPAVLDKYGLVGAIGDTAKNLGLDTETGFTLDARPMPDLAPQVEEAAFRIASEALNNVVKHANASSCGVIIETVVDQLVVRVRDDGTWVTSRSGGVGLDSMRRRVEALGGELEVTSDQGTTVTAGIPLEQS